MPINLVIAVTDGDWFEMLRRQPNLNEVNFWAPSAANFRALQPGELFLFNLSAPSIDNAAFLKEATQITLAELEAATGMLAIAAREMCELG